MAEQNPMEAYMDQEEAAKYIKFSPITLQMWRSADKGPAYFRIGGKVRYAKEDLDKWMLSRRIVPELNARVA